MKSTTNWEPFYKIIFIFGCKFFFLDRIAMTIIMQGGTCLEIYDIRDMLYTALVSGA